MFVMLGFPRKNTSPWSVIMYNDFKRNFELFCLFEFKLWLDSRGQDRLLRLFMFGIKRKIVSMQVLLDVQFCFFD